MKIEELKKEIQQYQYLEDTNIIEFALACIIANRLKLSSPVWSIIIGASSGGKSQILNPLTLSDEKFIHRVDDLTENTFLSGAKSKEGSNSLLTREGGVGKHGIITISDMTVILSKSGDSRATILSQFRMLYDGELVKHSGNQKEPLKWQGYLGVIAGSTPTLYNIFEEVADMGERFIYYRMKEFDRKRATNVALSRGLFGRELDMKLSGLYKDYITDVIKNYDDTTIELPQNIKKRIIEVANFSETVRTPVSKDWSGEYIDKTPVPAYPMRVSLQLMSIAKALAVITFNETGEYTITDKQLDIIDWVGYSLANEEKRATLKILANNDYDFGLQAQTVADEIGLDTKIARQFLQNLTAVGVLSRKGEGNSLRYTFKNQEYYDLVRRIEKISNTTNIEHRDLTDDESDEMTEAINDQFNAL